MHAYVAQEHDSLVQAGLCTCTMWASQYDHIYRLYIEMLFESCMSTSDNTIYCTDIGMNFLIPLMLHYSEIW